MVGGASKSKKGRKYDRNRAKCARYRAEGRRERNKARRIARNQARGVGTTGAWGRLIAKARA